MGIIMPQPSVGYTPADFQLTDLDYLLKRSWSANWSEMGCYKTTTALWLAGGMLKKVEAKAPAILICTTKMGKGTYFDAIPKTLPDWIFLNITHKGVSRIELGGLLEVPIDGAEFVRYVTADTPTVVLSHYHNYLNNAKMLRTLASIEWDGMFVDEAHRMKNKDSQWTRNLKKIKITENGFKHIMTGTGFINRPDEIWSLLNFLNKVEFSSYWNFRREFCEEYVDASGYTKILGIYEHKKEDFRNLRKLVGVRRELKDVRPDIDAPIETTVSVDLNPIQRKMYNELRDYLFTLDQKGVPVTSPNVLSQLQRLRQICVATPEKYDEYYDPKQERLVQKIRLIEPSSKLDAVMELLDDMSWDEESKQQVVVFSCFKDPLKLLEDRLFDAQIPYLRMVESMNEKERYELWHDIWPKKEHRVFLTTLALGGESINLTSAQHGIFLDRSWSPKDNAQAIGRIYRPGQTGQTQIIYINAKATTDARIAKANEIKMGWFKDIFGDDEDA